MCGSATNLIKWRINQIRSPIKIAWIFHKFFYIILDIVSDYITKKENCKNPTKTERPIIKQNENVYSIQTGGYLEEKKRKHWFKGFCFGNYKHPMVTVNVGLAILILRISFLSYVRNFYNIWQKLDIISVNDCWIFLKLYFYFDGMICLFLAWLTKLQKKKSFRCLFSIQPT